MTHVRCDNIVLVFLVFCFASYAQTDADMLLIPAGEFIMGEQTPRSRSTVATDYLPSRFLH